VLLDDKVDLEVPLDDLAVHEPDARKLIAFLKAMEFSTLTRRVADYSQIDPSDVEADAGNKSGAGVKDASSAAPAKASAGASGDLFAGATAPAAKPGGAKEDKAASHKGTPVSLAAAREEAIRKIAFDRKKYQTISSLDQLKAWIVRVHDVGHLVIEAMSDSIDPMQAEISGIALALAPNDACYVPLAHKQSGGWHRPVRCRPRPGPDQGRRCTRGVEAALGIGRHPQDRLQHQIQCGDAGAARHHAAQP
jgi:DNA polymerase-1